jgi:SOS-response transcriptional repressor LexA
LLEYVAGFILQHGYGPSYREMMNGCNYKSLSVVALHVDNLVANGYMVKKDRSARSLELTPKGRINVKDTLVKNEQPVNQKTYEKWLIEKIDAKFESAKKTMDTKDIDNLYVLVGALQILGYDAATTAFKAKLQELIIK